MLIERIRARQVLDSRGNPTVEVELKSKAAKTIAIVPSGASTGSREALELRDSGTQYNGKSVLRAVTNVNTIIAPKLIGRSVLEQEELDKLMIELDGTPNKSKLGANAILAVSLAICKNAALAQKMELFEYIGELFGSKKFVLPVPQMNVLNSGKHAGIENDIQEHMIAPLKFNKFSEALRAGVESYIALKELLKKKFGARATLVADEGGFAPPIAEVEKRLEFILKAVKNAGYDSEIMLALDAASSEFYNNKEGKYKIRRKKFSREELVDFYKSLCKKYPIYSIEDGFAENDADGWALLMEELGGKIQIVADDLTVSNPKLIDEAATKNLANALLLKVNQIGTVSEALEAARTAFKADWKVIVSHRSGETEDSFIADLVVGIAAGQCKFGAPARTDRTAKYNQLLRIEDVLGKKATFAANSILEK
ncbi:MAG: phosphopyruvate hydratase [Candidatus Diapherotrites archaeon]|nr:phosphopyruvate hydratase [Candidatus Diapherotrites archaeon]